MQSVYAYSRGMAGDEESQNRLITLDYKKRAPNKPFREIIIDAARGDVYDMFELIQQNKMIALSSF